MCGLLPGIVSLMNRILIFASCLGMNRKLRTLAKAAHASKEVVDFATLGWTAPAAIRLRLERASQDTSAQERAEQCRSGCFANG